MADARFASRPNRWALRSVPGETPRIPPQPRNASSWSPRSLNRFNRSSTSKNPACLRIESSPIHPSQWNQKGGELARFLEASIFSNGSINIHDDINLESDAIDKSSAISERFGWMFYF